MWDETEVNRNLEKIMIKSFEEVWEMSIEKDCSLRTAAYMVAMSRLVEAHNIRGVFP